MSVGAQVAADTLYDRCCFSVMAYCADNKWDDELTTLRVLRERSLLRHHITEPVYPRTKDAPKRVPTHFFCS